MMLSVGEYSRHFQFNWADKTALVLGFVFFVLLLFFLTIDFIAAGGVGVRHLWRAFGIQAIELNLLVAGLSWLSLRGFDYLIHALYRFIKAGPKRETGEVWRAEPRPY